MDIGDDLPATKSDCAAHDPLLDSDAVRHDGVPALRNEPQASVLEHEGGRKHTVDRGVERVDRCVDGSDRVVGRIRRAHRILDRSGEQAGIERPRHAGAR